MNILFTCGGTGGHIYPAIAIADKIRRRHPEANILFVGTQRGMEQTIVPQAGYDIESIEASGFVRRSPLANVSTFRNLVRGSAQARKILTAFRPGLVLGTGGYVTLPVIREASKKGIPAFLHEQNAAPGLANRLLQRYATGVFVSFESTVQAFPRAKSVVHTGNPVRREFVTASIADCRAELGLSGTDFVALAFGGSLGAEQLNAEVTGAIERLGTEDIHWLFVTGKRYYEEVQAHFAGSGYGERVTLIDYADNMPCLLQASDLVVSRAGALALAEITVCGKASILIPSPNVTDDHQTHNARELSRAGAAILLAESDIGGDGAVLADVLMRLLHNKPKLNDMARASFALGRADAADIIYEQLSAYISGSEA